MCVWERSSSAMFPVLLHVCVGVIGLVCGTTVSVKEPLLFHLLHVCVGVIGRVW